MKNKKGFTLVEMIAVIIILGVLAIIAFQVFTRNLEGFRDDYYVNLSNTINSAGKEFFTDNRKYLPKDVLTSTKVSLATLEELKYVDEINDYDKNSCDKDGYVIAINMGKGKYEYHSCFVCPDDEYSTMEDNFCDSVWLTDDNRRIGLGDLDPIYIYKGTERDSLRELLKVYASIKKIKVLENGEEVEIGVASGEGEEYVPEIYPDNMDIIDTEKNGTYVLQYNYEGEVKLRDVVVFSYEKPTMELKFKDIILTNASNGTRACEGVYAADGNVWSQIITTNFSISSAQRSILGSVGMTSDKAKYQILTKTGWHDYCTSLTASYGCSMRLNDYNGTTMIDDVKFRLIDEDGHIGLETSLYKIRMDEDDPVIESFTVNSTAPTDGKLTLTGKASDATSKIKGYQITTSSNTPTTWENVNSEATITKTKEIIYSATYYFWVIDNANNVSVKSIVINNIKCEKGKYSSNGLKTSATSCIVCPVGQYSNAIGTVTCTKCNEGYYQDKTGQTSCNKCAPGSHASNKGQATCDLCAKGYFASSEAAVNCLPCAKGYFASAEGTVNCSKCPKGQYAANEGTINCTKCAKGYYANVEATVTCTKCRILCRY